MMNEIKLDKEAVANASRKLNNELLNAESMEKKVQSVHNVLWLDDALTNAFSSSLLSEINSAYSRLNHQKNLLSQYNSIMGSVSGTLSDADESAVSAATASVASAAKSIINWKTILALAVPGSVSWVLPSIGAVVSSLGESSSGIPGECRPLFGTKASQTQGTTTTTIYAHDYSDSTAKVYEDIRAAQKTETEVYSSNYSDGVQKGHIRYVYQLGSYDDKIQNGWGDYAGYASGECGYASQSMAFSYLGKDVPPYQLCREEYSGANRWGGTNFASTYAIEGVQCESGSGMYFGNSSGAVSKLNSMLESFQTDANRGDYSPVVVHYSVNGSGGIPQHTILAVGINADGSYAAIDTARGNGIYNYHISESGKIYGSGLAHGGGYIDGIQQFISSE